MQDVLERYVGQVIGMNSDKPQQFRPVRLMEVTPTRLTVTVGPKAPVFHYGLPLILSLAEGNFRVGARGSKVDVPLLVQIAGWIG
jgi:hypothetical protein